MGCEKGLEYIYAQEHKLYHYYYHFRGHWGNKNWKNDNKNVWSIFLSPTLKGKGNKHCNGFSILIVCLHCAIIWFSLFIGVFHQTKIHHGPLNSPFEAIKCTTMPLKVIVYNYPLKGRGIVVDIYQEAKQRGIYPPLFTDPRPEAWGG